MVICGSRNGSSILPLQIQDILFSAMALLRHILNYVINLTVPFRWTFWFFSVVLFWSLVTWFQCNFIMSRDEFWHIFHVTVANFNCIVGENFVKFVASWKMFCWQLS